MILPGVTPGEAARAVQAFLATDHVEVERLTSKGLRRLDARAAVVTLELDRRAAQDSDAGCAILRMVVRHMTPAVRPDDILAALRQRGSPRAVVTPAGDPAGAGAAWHGGRCCGDYGGAVAGSGDLMRPEPARPAATGQVPAPVGHDGRNDRKQKPAPGGAAAAVANAAAATAPASANEQLPRGAQGPDTGPRAREPDGRLPGCSTASLTTGNQTTRGRPMPAAPMR